MGKRKTRDATPTEHQHKHPHQKEQQQLMATGNNHKKTMVATQQQANKHNNNQTAQQQQRKQLAPNQQPPRPKQTSSSSSSSSSRSSDSSSSSSSDRSFVQEHPIQCALRKRRSHFKVVTKPPPWTSWARVTYLNGGLWGGNGYGPLRYTVTAPIADTSSPTPAPARIKKPSSQHFHHHLY